MGVGMLLLFQRVTVAAAAGQLTLLLWDPLLEEVLPLLALVLLTESLRQRLSSCDQ